MLNIQEIKNTTDLNSGKVKKTSSGESFASYLNGVMKPQNNAISGTTGIAVTDAIFAAQMVDSEEQKERRRQAIKRGNSLIDRLEEIRDGLLCGQIAKDKLIEISRFVKDNKLDTEDEHLNDILAEIELRVEVELAKLMR